MWHWLEWTGIVAVWMTFGWQVRSIIRVYRRRKEDRSILLAQIANEEEITPLQVEAAMDAATAVFVTRIEEMRRANRAHS